MTYKAKVTVCSEIRRKHSTQSEHHVEFWMLKLVVRKETVGFKMLKQVVQAAKGNALRQIFFLIMNGQEYTKPNGRSSGKNRNRHFQNKKKI